ncbi:oxidoreductase [Virgibacillus litoralis]|uniref:2,4-dienoyl-CoA reductase-like NADH-dependent reductase (Old Yellow Enzyme family)/thioredoxin reductase n=1 Tax=Virgibacillus litoralis TaxID=578221 RepID=A0ABS4HBV0_9BACI|nr:FAD-dependent oxidoreductase [Virgibacillus litoralis]MBP1948380.1 2,4-dienoyl-CoA reductase-like NADH-dependent reductase (Old Yellow Enzyme family)/thioredoxin reductase [Virgibacillus litoralis]
MTKLKYPQLFSKMKIGNTEFKNRIMTSGHQTTLVEDHLPTDDFVAYHTERAKGGVGLIVMEAHGVHHTGLNTPFAIDASNPKIVDIHRNTAANVHQYGGKLFAQLIHHGREAYVSEENNDVVAPSAVPTERFHIIPRELEEEEIQEIIDGFVGSAMNLKEAGLDGVEFVGSHTYLFEQFWSPAINKRTDHWGGSFENRMRFTKEVIKRVRDAVGEDFVLGMRMSLHSKDDVGTSGEESLKVIRYLHGLGELNYWSLVIGSSASYKGSSYIVPPANDSASQLFTDANQVREIIGKTPLIITSRIYAPEIAERFLQEKDVDIVGMTRALIADPHLPSKILADNEQQIIPCIACNQGCIGRYQEHLPIRCTINPVTGREKHFADVPKAARIQSFSVIGGGPSGIMAALTLAKNGHHVTLFEEKNQLGGQLNVIQGALNRDQVGNWQTYLISELKRLNVKIETGKRVTVEVLNRYQFDGVIVATGSKPLIPEKFTTNIASYSSWDVLNKEMIKEENIIVIDWKGDWPGIESAELLASQNKNVEIVSRSYGIAEAVQQYKRNKFLERMDELGVKQTPNFKLVELKKEKVVLEHLFSGRKEEREPEAIIFAVGQDASDYLAEFRKIKSHFKNVLRIGDAKSPRTLDEAVWEGFHAALKISEEKEEAKIYG